MAWWPSSRGLTGFASAVLRALFEGFDGMVASGAAVTLSTQREGKHRTLGSEKVKKAQVVVVVEPGHGNIRIKKVARLNMLTDESECNERPLKYYCESV